MRMSGSEQEGRIYYHLPANIDVDRGGRSDLGNPEILTHLQLFM